MHRARKKLSFDRKKAVFYAVGIPAALGLSTLGAFGIAAAAILSTLMLWPVALWFECGRFEFGFPDPDPKEEPKSFRKPTQEPSREDETFYSSYRPRYQGTKKDASSPPPQPERRKKQPEAPSQQMREPEAPPLILPVPPPHQGDLFL